MKTEVTRRKIAGNFDCISVGYCELANLLSYERAQYYTTGVYGWNFDAYIFDLHGKDVCITTGYRGMITNCKNSYSFEIAKKYDDIAREICRDRQGEKKERLHKLIEEFLGVVFKY